jgi:hypothetical protein
MPWFRCFVRGEDFPGSMIGMSHPVGFYVTKFVEAADAEQAELRALDRLRADPKLAPPPGFRPTDKSRVFFEAIEEVAADEVPDPQPGIAWYPMGSDS